MEKEKINEVLRLSMDKNVAEKFLQELDDPNNIVMIKVDIRDHRDNDGSHVTTWTPHDTYAQVDKLLYRHLCEIREEAKALVADLDRQLEEL